MAPVILFVYNRPWHTKETINALKKNDLVADTELYIYADGPRHNSSEVQLLQIRKLHDYLQTIRGFKKINIIQNEKNSGLANSIINGVTEVINNHKKIIVLEDDIVTGKGFLRYMNEALELYANNENVGCIHAWNYKLNTRHKKGATFFLKGADCWGWATWQRAWKLFNKSGEELLKSITEKKLEYEFNRRNTHDYVNMLKDQTSGKNDSWAIRWHASLFLENKYCLHPVKALTKNIGLDNSGENCVDNGLKQHLSSYIKLNNLPVEESEWFFKAYKKYLVKTKSNKWQKLRNLSDHLFHRLKKTP